MTNEENQIKILELKIEEQRKDFDVALSFYEQAKVKNITFLASALGLLAYLYANPGEESLRDKLFIPSEPYGIIIYGVSFIVFMSSIIMLLIALKPLNWSTAYVNGQYGDEGDYLTYLKYINGRYESTSKTNGDSYNKKQTLLDISFIPLLISATILLLLKTFGG